MRPEMRIVVLGAAAGGGFPQWNCRCAVCREAWSGRAAPQTQSSLAVSADGANWFLLNASPDLRTQILSQPQLQPREGARHSPIIGAVLTNGDVDHVAGLLSLRESHPLAVYATPTVLGVLRGNSIFNVLNADSVARRTLPIGEPVELRARDDAPAGLRVEAFPVPGKAPLYLEDERITERLAVRGEDTIGLAISAADAPASRFYYLPACAVLDAELRQRLAGARLVFFDGTLWRDDEMIRAGVGQKTGRRMGHMSMDGPDGSLAAFADLRVDRKIFIHINNTNPVLCAGSAERAAVEAAGWDVARDGMELTL
jgi:pyrroloquinoline quinone biosynthesis protein B